MTDFMEQARAMRNGVLWQSNSSVQVIAAALRENYERGLEHAASIAEKERMEGVPPIGQMTEREIEIVEATCRVTAESIAQKIRDAIGKARERGLDEAAKIVDEWLDTGTMLLRAGEMTAQELRTAKAVVTAIAASIHRLKEARS